MVEVRGSWVDTTSEVHIVREPEDLISVLQYERAVDMLCCVVNHVGAAAA